MVLRTMFCHLPKTRTALENVHLQGNCKMSGRAPLGDADRRKLEPLRQFCDGTETSTLKTAHFDNVEGPR